jgi:hypothetical protein
MRERDDAQNQESVCGATPRALTAFGDLPPETWIDKAWLMDVFNCSDRTIERAVQEGKLPPPLHAFGKAWWTIKSLNMHTEHQLSQMAKAHAAERQGINNQLEALPGGRT